MYTSRRRRRARASARDPRSAARARAGILVGIAAALAVPPAGAAATPEPSAASAAAHLALTGAIDLVGHGDGPGIGMGQWGAFGDAVRYHLDYERILDQYYGGTASTSLAAIGRASEPLVRVLVLENMNLATNRGFDPVVTSASAFTVLNGTVAGAPGVAGAPPTTTTPTTTTPPVTTPSTSPATTPPTTTPTTTMPSTTTSVPPTTTTVPPTTTSAPRNLLDAAVRGPARGGRAGSLAAQRPHRASLGALVVPGGEAVDLRLAKNGTWSAFAGTSCASARAASSAPLESGLVNPVVVPSSSAPQAPVANILTLCRHDGVDEPLRGSIEAFDRGGFERTIDLAPLDAYLAGVVPGEESPSWALDGGTAGAPQGQAWGFQALEAQAVAGRSYTEAYAAAGGWDGYADICDTGMCQAYVGAKFESPLSDAAVAATAGEVRGVPGTQVVASTRYSASTGGYTAPSAFPAVADPGDACVVRSDPLQCNPNHTWRTEVAIAALEHRLPGIGGVTGVRVVARNRRGTLGGRASTIVVTGTLGSRSLSGYEFASALGLRSDWFAIARIVP